MARVVRARKSFELGQRTRGVYGVRFPVPIITDYHIHTPLCLHATGPMEACVERALTLGLREMGFACHNPLPRGLGANVRMREDQLDGYVQSVLALRAQYRGRIDVLLGLEMDFLEGLEDYLAAQLVRYPWDYIIGSIHYLDRECQLHAWAKQLPFDADEQYSRYYRLLQQLARSGFCDIIAHLDVPKRSRRSPGPRGVEEQNRALQEIARAGLCMEINTSGHRHPELASQPDTYPSLLVVQQAMALNISLMVNSDAHAPEHVGTKFAETEDALRRIGCQQLAKFRQRRREMYAF